MKKGQLSFERAYCSCVLFFGGVAEKTTILGGLRQILSTSTHLQMRGSKDMIAQESYVFQFIFMRILKLSYLEK